MDIEALYRRYGPMVLRRCRFMLRDEAQAVEAMQDVFVLMLRHQDRLEDHAPSALLHRLATNTCLNRLRSGRRRPEDSSALLDTFAHHEDTSARALARRLLDQLFGRVAASTKTLAMLHYVDGMTLEQVAEESGLSVSGVRKRLAALRQVALAAEALP